MHVIVFTFRPRILCFLLLCMFLTFAYFVTFFVLPCAYYSIVFVYCRFVNLAIKFHFVVEN